MKFEYETIFVPLTYIQDTSNGFFKSDATFKPDTETFMNRPEYLQLLKLMGEEGWELISVQSALNASYKVSESDGSSYGVGFPLTAGYFLFWKRAKE